MMLCDAQIIKQINIHRDLARSYRKSAMEQYEYYGNLRMMRMFRQEEREANHKARTLLFGLIENQKVY